MPYLSSVWFVQAMLCKVNKVVPYSKTYDVTPDWLTFWEELYTNNSWVNQTISFSFTRASDGTSRRRRGYYIWASKPTNTNQITQFWADDTTGTVSNKTIANGNSLWIACRDQYSAEIFAGQYISFTSFTVTATPYLYVSDTNIKGYPKENVVIWALGIIILFWVKPNGEREYGPLENKSEFSSSATTGSITPGNYVGYVTIEAKDGTIYKVWVYNI